MGWREQFRTQFQEVGWNRFVPPRNWRTIVLPVPAIPKIAQVELIKAIGVTFSRQFSVTQHVENVLACAQILIALSTLRQHGMPTSALHAVFKTTVGQVMDAILRRSAWLGYRNTSYPNFINIFVSSLMKRCSTVSNKTLIIFCTRFSRQNAVNIIRCGQRSSSFQITTPTSALNHNKFITRIECCSEA